MHLLQPTYTVNERLNQRAENALEISLSPVSFPQYSRLPICRDEFYETAKISRTTGTMTIPENLRDSFL